MAIRLLLIDPNPQWLAEAKAFLKDYQYEVDVVTTGKEAQLSLYKNEYFAVVLNLCVENYSGTEVLNYLNTSGPSVTTVVTAEKDRKLEEFEINPNKLAVKKISDYLIKPFEMDQLLSTIEGNHEFSHVAQRAPSRQGASEEEEVSLEDDKFTKIKIDEFYSAKAVLFNVYIKLKSGRYIKILNAGDTFEASRIKKYKDQKKIEFLYFLKKDNRRFLRLQNYISKQMVKNKDINANAKITFLKNAGEKFVESIYTEGLKPQILEEGEELCQNILTMAKGEPDLSKTLRKLEDLDPSKYSHSFLVSFFSTLLAQKLSWGSKVTTQLVGMGALFHDIGYIKLPKEIAEKNPKDLNEEERKIYEQHPILGAELVDGQSSMPTVVKQIILQHHEDVNGHGFPYRLSGPKILSIAKIIHFTDEFAHLLTDQKLQPLQALKTILEDPECTVRHPSAIIENFIKLFVSPDKLK